MPILQRPTFFAKLKVRSKLILLLVTGSYVSILFVGALSYIIGRNIINERVASELELSTDTIMESVNKMIFDRFNDIQLLTSDSLLYDSVIDPSQKTDILLERLFSLGWYDNLYITDANGMVISATNPDFIGMDLSEENWYKDTFAEFIHVTDVLVSPLSQNETIIFSGVLSDEDKNLIGVLGAELSLDVLSDTLERAPENLEVFLISSEGGIIAQNGPQRYDPKIQSDYIVREVYSNGYLDFRGNDWILIVQIHKSLAYAPLKTFGLFVLLSMVGMGALAVLSGQSAARYFVKPIEQLTQGVSKIQQGNLRTNIKVLSQDELGFLARNFNSMTSSLLEKTQNLLEEKGKYVAILESVNEGIVLFDARGKLLAMNAQFRHLFKQLNYKEMQRDQELLGFLMEQNPSIKKLIETQDVKKTVMAELTLTEPYYRILDLYTKPVETEEGGLLGRIWIFNDVTEQREAEKVKNEFILVASHKLRTPLTAINWTTEMLKDESFGSLSKEQLQAMEEIMKSVERLNELIELLLNVGQISRNKIPISMKSFVLEEVLQRALSRMKNRFPNFSSEAIKVTIPKRILSQKFRGDDDKIHLVLEILLDNAFRYQKSKNKIQIHIDAKPLPGGKRLEILIKDQGIGVDLKDQSKIFTKFFRTEDAMLQHTEGVGLNLYLAKMIMESSREKMFFKSQKGKGSTFSFTLTPVKKLQQ